MTAARVARRAWRAPCRASAFGPTSTGWRARRGSPATCSTTSAASLLEVEGAADAVDAFVARLAAEAPPLARDRVGRVDAAAADRRARVPDPRQRARRRAGRAGRAPTPRPARTAWPSCSIPADRRFRYPFVNCTNCGPRFTIVARRPLRPAADDDGRLRDVRRAAGPSTTTRPTAASTPSPTRARSAGRAVRLGDADGRRRDDADAPRPLLLRRRDRGRQGPGRLPPRLPRRRRGGRRARCARASTARTSRSR